MASEMKRFHLSTFDQTMLRMYVRHLLIFEFPDPSHAEDATVALRASLLETLGELPFLAGTLCPTDSQAHRLCLEYPDTIFNDLLDKIFTINFNEAENIEYKFPDLERAGFPPSKLPRNAFCPELLFDHPSLDDAFAERLISFKKGLPVPVFAAQANFIMGGLILSIYSNHVVLDGTGIAGLYQRWSAHMRDHVQDDRLGRLSISPISAETSAPASSDLDHLRHAFDQLAESTELVDYPEVRSPGSSSRSPPLRSDPYNLAARIFVFSEVMISRLSAEVSIINNARTSAFTTLVALLWAQISRSRASKMLEKHIETVKLSIAFDHRKNLGEPFTSSYLGNCATGILAASPVSVMLATATNSTDAQSLAPICQSISDTVTSITLDWLKARLALFAQTPNSYQLSMDVDIPNGPDVFVTSWMHLGADIEWSIPGTTTKNPRAMRKPESRVEGNIHILPRSKAGGGSQPFEVMVSLEEGELEIVAQTLQREGWVETIIEA